MLVRVVVALVTLVAALGGITARAQTLLETTLVLGAPEAIELPLTVATSGTYRITVTDFGSAAGTPRLARVDAGVVLGSELVTAQGVAASNATGVGTRTFTAPAGEYRLLIVGRPNAPTSTVGSAGVRVDDPVGGAALLDTVQAFRVPPPPAASPATFEHELAVPAGAYTLQTTDFALPQPLAALQTTVIRRSDGALLADVSGPAEIALNAGNADTFEVFVFAELAGDAPRGLVGLNLRDNFGALHASEVHELGAWPFKFPVAVTAAASLDVSLANLGFPLPLATLGGEIARDGRRAAPRVTPGAPVAFAATPGPYTVYVDAVPAASSGGSFGLRVSAGAAILLDEVENVVVPGPPTDVAAIDEHFDVTADGTYTLTLTDFGTTGFFDPFTSLALALTRDNQIVQTLTAPGSFAFAATPGRYFVAILADPAGSAGEGLLGFRVTGGPATATVLDTTRAVGTEFIASTIDVASAATVEVRLADLGFPANLASLKLAVTRGSERVGEIVGGGSFAFAATPGTYRLNLLARPSASVAYGTVGLRARVAPVPPVVTFGASAASVTVGTGVTLTWSSTNATDCAASQGWSGARAPSGTETIAALNADATFVLACTGEGGSDSKSVAVAVTAAQRSSGGGGVVDVLLLGVLLGAWLIARRARGPARAAA